MATVLENYKMLTEAEKQRVEEIDTSIGSLQQQIDNINKFLTVNENGWALMVAKLKRERLMALTALTRSRVLLAEMEIFIAENALKNCGESDPKKLKLSSNEDKSDTSTSVQTPLGDWSDEDMPLGRSTSLSTARHTPPSRTSISPCRRRKSTSSRNSTSLNNSNSSQASKESINETKTVDSLLKNCHISNSNTRAAIPSSNLNSIATKIVANSKINKTQSQTVASTNNLKKCSKNSNLDATISCTEPVTKKSENLNKTKLNKKKIANKSKEVVCDSKNVDLSPKSSSTATILISNLETNENQNTVSVQTTNNIRKLVSLTESAESIVNGIEKPKSLKKQKVPKSENSLCKSNEKHIELSPITIFPEANSVSNSGVNNNHNLTVTPLSNLKKPPTDTSSNSNKSLTESIIAEFEKPYLNDCTSSNNSLTPKLGVTPQRKIKNVKIRPVSDINAYKKLQNTLNSNSHILYSPVSKPNIRPLHPKDPRKYYYTNSIAKETPLSLPVPKMLQNTLISKQSAYTPIALKNNIVPKSPSYAEIRPNQTPKYTEPRQRNQPYPTKRPANSHIQTPSVPIRKKYYNSINHRQPLGASNHICVPCPPFYNRQYASDQNSNSPYRPPNCAPKVHKPFDKGEQVLGYPPAPRCGVQ